MQNPDYAFDQFPIENIEQAPFEALMVAFPWPLALSVA
jgi:hypothetical protein